VAHGTTHDGMRRKAEQPALITHTGEMVVAAAKKRGGGGSPVQRCFTCRARTIRSPFSCLFLSLSLSFPPFRADMTRTIPIAPPSNGKRKFVTWCASHLSVDQGTWCRRYNSQEDSSINNFRSAPPYYYLLSCNNHILSASPCFGCE
jgi:hypothetical protein